MAVAVGGVLAAWTTRDRLPPLFGGAGRALLILGTSYGLICAASRSASPCRHLRCGWSSSLRHPDVRLSRPRSRLPGMVPDYPEAPDYPASPWQTVALFAISGLVFLLAVWGGIDLAMRATGWFS